MLPRMNNPVNETAFEGIMNGSELYEIRASADNGDDFMQNADWLEITFPIYVPKQSLGTRI